MDFLLTILATSTTTALLISALAFLCKSQITHWLTKDLEATKNRYAKELETHKLALMGDAERIRAAQEVRKASALWVVERKYKSYMDALDSVVGLGSEIGSLACIDPHFKTEHSFRTACDRVERLRRAGFTAAPFLPASENAMLNKLFAHCLPLLKHCVAGSPMMNVAERERLLDPLFDMETEVETALFARIEALSNV